MVYLSVRRIIGQSKIKSQPSRSTNDSITVVTFYEFDSTI